MSDTTNCPRTECSCPCLPKVTLDQAVIDLVESIALQENALSHILCAESRKMNAAMELDGLDLCKLLEVNDSATNMVHAVANLELVLKDKLEFISNNLYTRLQVRIRRLPAERASLPARMPGGHFLSAELYKFEKNHLLELLMRPNCAILYNVSP